MPPRDSTDLKDTRPGMAAKKKSPEQKKWELANDHVKSNDFDRAKKVLAELTSRPNPFKAKAGKLLKEIEKESIPLKR